MGHGWVNYVGQGWAQVGQVDLTWTTIGPKELILGCTIEVKVYGDVFLKETAGKAVITRVLDGYFDLRSVLSEIWFPYNFIWNWLAPL